MNTPKRVSFGSKGSMVETWIIYDEKDNQSLTQTDHAETQFQRNILLNTGQEHDYQANHHTTTNTTTNLQYHQHNHLYQQEHENNNNNNNQEQKYHHEQQLQQQAQQHQPVHQHQQYHHEHNNNNNNNYSQQHQHHLPPSSSPPPPPPAKHKELRVTFSDSPICDSRYGEQSNRLSKSASASSNCDVDISNLNTAFQRRPIKRSQSLESRDNPFVPGGELAIDTDDILKRATIVRDKFILDEQEKRKQAEEAALKNAALDKPDGASDVGKNADTKDPGTDLPKENGKLGEEKAEQLGSCPPSAGQTGDLQDAPSKEKKKQKKKCCTIM